MLVAKFAHDGRQRQLFDAGDLGGNGAEGGAYAGVLAKYIDAEAAAVAGHVREVHIVPAAQLVLLSLAGDLCDIAFQLGLAQFAELDRHQIAVHSQQRGDRHREVDVRASLVGA